MKKLTKEKLYEIMDNFVAADSIYRELLPYLADEHPAEHTQVTNGYQKLFDYMQDEHDATLLETDMQGIIRIVQDMNPTKPEPSRLEVAAMVAAGGVRVYNGNTIGLVKDAYYIADELIKQSRL